MSCAKWWQFCLGLNVFKVQYRDSHYKDKEYLEIPAPGKMVFILKWAPDVCYVSVSTKVAYM